MHLKRELFVMVFGGGILLCGCLAPPLDLVPLVYESDRMDEEGYLVTHYLYPRYAGRQIHFSLPEPDELEHPGLKGWFSRVRGSHDSWFFYRDGRRSAEIHIALKSYLASKDEHPEADLCRWAEKQAISDASAHFTKTRDRWEFVEALTVSRVRYGDEEWENLAIRAFDKATRKRRIWELNARCCGYGRVDADQAELRVVVSYLQMTEGTAKDYGQIYRRAYSRILSTVKCCENVLGSK